MFFARGIWCLADVSSVTPSSEQTLTGWQYFYFILASQCVYTSKQFDQLIIGEKFDSGGTKKLQGFLLLLGTSYHNI